MTGTDPFCAFPVKRGEPGGIRALPVTPETVRASAVARWIVAPGCAGHSLRMFIDVFNASQPALGQRSGARERVGPCQAPSCCSVTVRVCSVSGDAMRMLTTTSRRGGGTMSWRFVLYGARR
jgi:hypothetical protein